MVNFFFLGFFFFQSDRPTQYQERHSTLNEKKGGDGLINQHLSIIYLLLVWPNQDFAYKTIASSIIFFCFTLPIIVIQVIFHRDTARAIIASEFLTKNLK